ncbi:MAG: cytochrome c-type biogenesis protein CcmH [Caulobacteraceae bacterium]|nr:cytochrome c-type biogenesis protein CcmH [Caulobacteraceae bacterium]
MRRLLLALAALACIAAAGDPSERLADPAQEARARALYREIRCVVCQNESIDDSEAEVAGLIRQSVREQIRAGRTDAEVRAYLVDRYGEFVLLKPALSPANLLLWGAPAALLVLAGGLLMWRARRAPAQIGAEPLTEEEEARIAALTGDPEGRHRFAPSSPSKSVRRSRRKQ